MSATATSTGRPSTGRAPGTDPETARMAAVARYDILDTPADGSFDRIAKLAARMLGTPMASVSFVDRDRIWAKASHGLDGAVETPRSPGLCATAILQDEPYAISDARTDPRAAEHPLVRSAPHIRFYAAAPITTADGFRLGVVSVFDTEPRQVTEAELDTLRDLAAVVMDELELRLSAMARLRTERQLREHFEGFATTLQRTLLPPSLPKVPGLELAAHYHAVSPSDVTGDFYDVFSLGDGRWAFFLGDVTGHGVAAATATSLTRYTLRAAALHSPDAESALAELNTALLNDPNVPQHCTVLLGILQPLPGGGFDVTLAGGGHPPAMLLRPDRHPRVQEIDLLGGMLLGAFGDAHFESRRLRLAPGESLLLYTDGLTEARPGGEFFDERRLADFLTDHVGTGAGALMDELVDLINGFAPAPEDDVALVALSVPR
ncbi:PP2C family protein-serine/threonine phosphatase [Saccharopolyspora cebuensis]|uniref:PP2C family protein-serine/threonine phosphatase n=2 Tax=Saccharopolyspora cebuensis TaxID=418759 RepID=A0ABV4CMM3_9PSEU